MTQSIANKFNNTIGAVANLDFASLYPSFQKSYNKYYVRMAGLKVKKIQKILENINGLSQD